MVNISDIKNMNIDSGLKELYDKIYEYIYDIYNTNHLFSLDDNSDDINTKIHKIMTINNKFNESLHSLDQTKITTNDYLIFKNIINQYTNNTIKYEMLQNDYNKNYIANLARLFLYDTSLPYYTGGQTEISIESFKYLLKGNSLNQATSSQKDTTYILTILKNYKIFTTPQLSTFKHDIINLLDFNTIHYDIAKEISNKEKRPKIQLQNIFKNIKIKTIEKYFLFALQLHGHAFGMFVKKNSETSFTLYILNSGLGSNNHCSSDKQSSQYIIKNNILLAPSIMYFENITYDDLESIYNIYNDINFEGTFKSFYDKIKNQFKKKLINPKFYYCELQNAHNCSFYLYILTFRLLLEFNGITDELLFVKIVNILRLYLLREEYFRLKFAYRYLNYQNDFDYNRMYQLRILNKNFFKKIIGKEYKKDIKLDNNDDIFILNIFLQVELDMINLKINKKHIDLQLSMDDTSLQINELKQINIFNESQMIDSINKEFKKINESCKTNNFKWDNIIYDITNLFDTIIEFFILYDTQDIIIHTYIRGLAMLSIDIMKLYIDNKKNNISIKYENNINNQMSGLLFRIFNFNSNGDELILNKEKKINSHMGFHTLFDCHYTSQNILTFILVILGLYSDIYNTKVEYDDKITNCYKLNDIVSILLFNKENIIIADTLTEFYNTYYPTLYIPSSSIVNFDNNNKSFDIFSYKNTEILCEKKIFVKSHERESNELYINNFDSTSFLLYTILFDKCVIEKFKYSPIQNYDIYKNPNDFKITILEEFHFHDPFIFKLKICNNITLYSLLNILNGEYTTNMFGISVPFFGKYKNNSSDDIKINDIYVTTSVYNQYENIIKNENSEGIILKNINLFFGGKNYDLTIFTILIYISYFDITIKLLNVINDIITHLVSEKEITSPIYYKLILIRDIHSKSLTYESYIYMNLILRTYRILISNKETYYESNFNFTDKNSFIYIYERIFINYVLEYMFNKNVMNYDFTTYSNFIMSNYNKYILSNTSKKHIIPYNKSELELNYKSSNMYELTTKDLMYNLCGNLAFSIVKINNSIPYVINVHPHTMRKQQILNLNLNLPNRYVLKDKINIYNSVNNGHLLTSYYVIDNELINNNFNKLFNNKYTYVYDETQSSHFINKDNKKYTLVNLLDIICKKTLQFDNLNINVSEKDKNYSKPLLKTYSSKHDGFVNSINFYNYIYQFIYKLFRFYLLYNKSQLLLTVNFKLNEFLLLTDDFRYEIVINWTYEKSKESNIFKLNHFGIKNIKIKDNSINKTFEFIDIYLDKTENYIRKYLIDTPNLLYIDEFNNKYIYFVTQFGAKLIKINPSGLIDNDPNETLLLYFLDCISNNLYYNIFHIYSAVIGYLEINNKDKTLEKYKYCLYQLNECINKDDTMIIYFINKLSKYFDIFNILKNDNYSELISDDNIFNATQRLPSIYTSTDLQNNNVIIKSDNKFIDFDLHVSVYESIFDKDEMNNVTENTILSIKSLVESNIHTLYKQIDIYHSDYFLIDNDLLNNLSFINNPTNYNFIRTCIDLNNLIKINQIINDNTIDNDVKFESYKTIVKKSSFSDFIPSSYAIFELLFGNYIRKDQLDLVKKINTSIYGGQKELFSFLMGAGKTSVIAPLLTFESMKKLLQSSEIPPQLFHVMPQSLVKSSYLLNMQYVSPIYSSIEYLPDFNTDIKIDNIKFGNINITSDEFIKKYKLYCVQDKKYWNVNNNDKNKYVFIFDEIDELANPLKNQLNITLCKESKDKLTNYILITKLFIDKLYDLEVTYKELYEQIFTNEKFYNIKNTNDAKKLYIDLFTNIVKELYDEFIKIIPQLNKNRSLFENIQTLKLYLTNYQSGFTDDIELNKFLDIMYNIYINSVTVFSSIRNVSYGLSTKPIKLFDELNKIIKNSSLLSENFIAIPYTAIDTPVYGSEFSNIYQKIIFTILCYYNRLYQLNSNIRINDLYLYMKNFIYDSYIKDLEDCKTANLPYDILLSEYNSLFKDSKYAANVPSINNIKTFGYTKDQEIYLINKIFISKNNISSYVDYLLKESLSNYEYIYNISTTELLLSNFCVNRTGFTGTPNMHIPYDIKDEIKQEINDDNVTQIKNSIITNKDYIHIVPSMNIDELIKIIIDNNYSVLIDSGAFIRDDIMKNINNLYDKLIETNKFKCIIFIDSEHSKKVIYKDGTNKIIELFSKNLLIPMKDRFYLFDHKHITGQDFIIYRKAIGLVTIRNDSKLRDIAQGIYRLRQINKGQTCRIVALESDFTKTIIKYDEIYTILDNNDKKYKNNTLNLFIRQNLYGIFRTYYETINKSYNINTQDINICNSLINIFENNIYLLKNIITEINKNTFKKNIDEILLDDIKNYITNKKDDRNITQFYDKLKSILILIDPHSQLLPTIATNIQVNVEQSIEQSIEESIDFLIQESSFNSKNQPENDNYGIKTMKETINKVCNDICDIQMLKLINDNNDNNYIIDSLFAILSQRFLYIDKFNFRYYLTSNSINLYNIIFGSIIPTNLIFKIKYNNSSDNNSIYSHVAYLTLINTITHNINIILLDIYSLNLIYYLLKINNSSKYEYQINTFKNYSLKESRKFYNYFYKSPITKYYCNYVAICANIMSQYYRIADTLLLDETKNFDIIAHNKFINNLNSKKYDYEINPKIDYILKNDKFKNIYNLLNKEIDFNNLILHKNQKVNIIYKLMLIKFIDLCDYNILTLKNIFTKYFNDISQRPDIYDYNIYKLLIGTYINNKNIFTIDNLIQYYNKILENDVVNILNNYNENKMNKNYSLLFAIYGTKGINDQIKDIHINIKFLEENIIENTKCNTSSDIKIDEIEKETQQLKIKINTIEEEMEKHLSKIKQNSESGQFQTGDRRRRQEPVKIVRNPTDILKDINQREKDLLLYKEALEIENKKSNRNKDIINEYSERIEYLNEQIIKLNKNLEISNKSFNDILRLLRNEKSSYEAIINNNIKQIENIKKLRQDNEKYNDDKRKYIELLKIELSKIQELSKTTQSDTDHISTKLPSIQKFTFREDEQIFNPTLYESKPEYTEGEPMSNEEMKFYEFLDKRDLQIPSKNNEYLEILPQEQQQKS